ncbi:MAG: SIS domain-containing protein [Bacilli bacterium]|nr:SIS domain-containing protein [Bacilli bacterium]
MNYENFTCKVTELINIINVEETKNIEKAALIIYQAMRQKGLLHIFCTGHSHMMAEEMFYRAGGLVQINPILEPFLMQHEGAARSTRFERLSGIAKIIFDSVDKKPFEPFLIVSNSGINAVPIEMALCAKENKNPVIVVTSRSVSEKLVSRVSSGKHLFELADVVIDNHAPNGDGIIETKYGNIGAVSTIVSTYIAQRLVLAIISNYEKDGISPVIYKSANINGGDEHNRGLFDEYEKRIRSLY